MEIGRCFRSLPLLAVLILNTKSFSKISEREVARKRGKFQLLLLICEAEHAVAAKARIYAQPLQRLQQKPDEAPGDRNKAHSLLTLSGSYDFHNFSERIRLWICCREVIPFELQSVPLFVALPD